MSLYVFFESYLEETPELFTVKAAPSQNYTDIYQTFKNRSKRLPVDSFYDMLFYQTFNKFSHNLREYEILRLKTKRLGFLTQRQFNLISSKDREG